MVVLRVTYVLHVYMRVLYMSDTILHSGHKQSVTSETEAQAGHPRVGLAGLQIALTVVFVQAAVFGANKKSLSFFVDHMRALWFCPGRQRDSLEWICVDSVITRRKRRTIEWTTLYEFRTHAILPTVRFFFFNWLHAENLQKTLNDNSPWRPKYIFKLKNWIKCIFCIVLYIHLSTVAGKSYVVYLFLLFIVRPLECSVQTLITVPSTTDFGHTADCSIVPCIALLYLSLRPNHPTESSDDKLREPLPRFFHASFGFCSLTVHCVFGAVYKESTGAVSSMDAVDIDSVVDVSTKRKKRNENRSVYFGLSARQHNGTIVHTIATVPAIYSVQHFSRSFCFSRQHRISICKHSETRMVLRTNYSICTCVCVVFCFGQTTETGTLGHCSNRIQAASGSLSAAQSRRLFSSVFTVFANCPN